MTTNPYVIAGGSNEVMHAFHPRLRYPDLWRGCVGAWAPCLGPTGLRLQDNTGRGNHGTLTSMDAATDWVVSQGRLALDFDGSNDFVNLGDLSLFDFGSGDYTVALWVMPVSIPISTRHQLLSKDDSAGRQFNIEINTETNSGSQGAVGHVQFVSNSTYHGQRTSANVLVAGVWQSIVIGRSGASLFISVNGFSRSLTPYTGAQVALSSMQSTSTEGYIAARKYSGFQEYFPGQVDDVRVYNRALTTNEIVILAQRRGIAYETKPTRYHMRGPTGGGGPTYTLACDAGSFSLTGIDAGLTANRLVTTDAGSFALTGIDAGLLANRLVTADAGSFALTGIDADLTYSGAGGPTYTLACDAGSFALTGIDAGLTANRLVTADAVAFTLTGIDAGLLASRTLTCDAGSFALTGIDAGLLANRLITADAGSFALTGIDVAFLANRLITADTGAFVLTGINADLTYSGATSSTSSLYYYLMLGS